MERIPFIKPEFIPLRESIRENIRDIMYSEHRWMLIAVIAQVILSCAAPVVPYYYPSTKGLIEHYFILTTPIAPLVGLAMYLYDSRENGIITIACRERIDMWENIRDSLQSSKEWKKSQRMYTGRSSREDSLRDMITETIEEATFRERSHDDVWSGGPAGSY